MYRSSGGRGWKKKGLCARAGSLEPLFQILPPFRAPVMGTADRPGRQWTSEGS